MNANMYTTMYILYTANWGRLYSRTKDVSSFQNVHVNKPWLYWRLAVSHLSSYYNIKKSVYNHKHGFNIHSMHYDQGINDWILTIQ